MNKLKYKYRKMNALASVILVVKIHDDQMTYRPNQFKFDDKFVISWLGKIILPKPMLIKCNFVKLFETILGD